MTTQTTAKKIDPQLKTIGAYLQKDEQNEKDMIFVIPEYQRGYSWEIEHCDKLWQDIESFMESSKNNPYFFGTIIIDCSEEGNRKFNLIDGQQRTTTFILLLKALLLNIQNTLEKIKKVENKATERTKKILEERQDEIIETLYNANTDERFEILENWSFVENKVFLENRSINEQYKDALKLIIDAKSFEISKENLKDKQETNFFKNFKFFYEKLEMYKESQLISFADTFLNKCEVIEIRSWQTEQAVAMFNSLNSKGMTLSDEDIISAQLFSNTHKKNRDEFNELWQEIKELTTQLNAQKIVGIDSILQQYMYITRAIGKEYININKESVSVNVTTPGLRRYYLDINPTLLKDPVALSNNILKIAQIWNLIKDYSIVKLLLKFNENAKIYLISYLNRYEIKEISENVVSNITECLLRLFVILELVDKGYSSTEFKTFLFGENIKLVDKNYSDDKIRNDFNQHINENEKWKEEDIKRSILAYKKHALVFLNEYLYIQEKNKEKPFFFDDSVNIEHIMPASGKNIATIRKDAGIEDEKEFKALVNQIGNKILLEENINKSISNAWFKTKKQTSVNEKTGYKDSQYAIASDLVAYPEDEWTINDIEKATERAANRIIKFIFAKETD